MSDLGRHLPARRPSQARVKCLALAVAAASGFATTAAEAPPDFRWARQAGSGDIDVGYGIAFDGAGDAFVTGFFSGTCSFGTTNLVNSGNEEMFLAKYDPGGRLLWARKAGGIGYDEGRAVAVDAAGNAYAAGLFQSAASFGSTNLVSAGESDIFIAKYDPAGNLLWSRRAGGSSFDEAYGLALDGAGNAYLTGDFTGPAAFGSTTLPSLSGSNNVFVAKCDPSGNFLWARSAGGDADDQGNAVVVDSATNVYVTGAFAGTITFAGTNLSATGAGGARDIFVAKYNGAGNLLWVRQAGGAMDDTGNGIVADSAGNIYVTGKISGPALFGSTSVSANGADLFLAKYDGAGNLLWVRKAGGNNSIYGDGGHAVKVDAAGNPCVAGYFSGSANFGPTNLATAGLDDLFIAKYDGNGNLLWVRKAGGGDLDIAYAIDVDAVDNIGVTGFFVGTAAFGGINLLATSSSPDRDILVAKLGSPTPPRVTVRKSGNNLLLSWPAPAGDFVLESTPSLPALSWGAVQAQTEITGTSRTVTFPASGARMFFRLRSAP